MSSNTHIAARSAPLLGNLYSVAIEAPSFRLSSFSRVTYRNNFAHKFRGFEAQSSSAIAFMGCENPPRGGKRLDIEIFMGTHFLDAARENDDSRNDGGQMGMSRHSVFLRLRVSEIPKTIISVGVQRTPRQFIDCPTTSAEETPLVFERSQNCVTGSPQFVLTLNAHYRRDQWLRTFHFIDRTT